MKRNLGLVILAFALGCQPGHPVGPEGPGLGALEDQVAALVNDHRQLVGCSRLVWNFAVAEVAVQHSADMLEREYFGHRDPDGNDLGDRLRAARIQFSMAGENIARGFRYEDAARAVFEGWLANSGHRNIIENCTFSQHGIGVVDYRWTHVFVK